jgi:uncharacterized cupredoxin-like copper-binding protein
VSRLPAALAVAVSIILASASGGAASAHATIAIRYSHFEPQSVTARAGAPITITLRNDDPIAHEWIVGTEEVHARHRTGTDPFHAQIPTEVTIPPFTTLVTTVMFEQPGEYQYICHLPGHEKYGMVGTLRVEAQ